MATPPRSRPVAPISRSYDRRPPGNFSNFFSECYRIIEMHVLNLLFSAPSYSKSGMKREYAHREEFHPRSRAVVDYSTRTTSDRRMAYRDDYPPHAPAYPDYPRSDPPRTTSRRPYIDDGYSQRYEREPASYRNARGREYDSLSGSKRPYAALVIF